jgi:hypothetical protein
MGTDITEPPRHATSSTMGMRPAGASAAHGGVESAPANVVAALSSSPSSPCRPAADGADSKGVAVAYAQDASGGTPSAGSAAFRRNAMSRRLTRFRFGTSAIGNHPASSLEPPTSLRSSPPSTVARYTTRIA